MDDHHSSISSEYNEQQHLSSDNSSTSTKEDSHRVKKKPKFINTPEVTANVLTTSTSVGRLNRWLPPSKDNETNNTAAEEDSLYNQLEKAFTKYSSTKTLAIKTLNTELVFPLIQKHVPLFERLEIASSSSSIQNEIKIAPVLAPYKRNFQWPMHLRNNIKSDFTLKQQYHNSESVSKCFNLPEPVCDLIKSDRKRKNSSSDDDDHVYAVEEASAFIEEFLKSVIVTGSKVLQGGDGESYSIDEWEIPTGSEDTKPCGNWKFVASVANNNTPVLTNETKRRINRRLERMYPSAVVNK